MGSIMITGTSGVSPLTGGNCSREEYDQYQREFAHVDGWDGSLPTKEEPMSEQFMTQEQTEAITEREAIADHLESLACDIAGAVLLLHMGVDRREVEAELHVVTRRAMLLRHSLLTDPALIA